MVDNGVSMLPEEHRDALMKAYSDHQEVLRGDPEVRRERARRVASLFQAAREAGWPNVAIGDACGITGTSASRIMGRNGDGVEPATDLIFPTYGGGYVPSSERVAPRSSPRTLTEEERQELAEVAALARLCTGSRPLDHPTRVASKKFSARIMKYHDEGVTWREIAEASGMQISGVRMRAQRHGYNSGPPPSIAAYKDQVRVMNTNKGDADAQKVAKQKRGKAKAKPKAKV